MSTSVVVVKIGGSLFHQADFVQRLKIKIAQLSNESSPSHLVLIAGGGPLVDALRKIDRVNPLSEEVAHWTAIHLIDVNARLLQSWWPELQPVDSMQALQARLFKPGYTLFCVEAYLRDQEPAAPGLKLFASWEITSDSIAARIARILGANRLVLLKSNPAQFGENLKKLVAAEVIDAAFPQFVTGLNDVALESLPRLT